jgi:hypothetical protein
MTITTATIDPATAPAAAKQDGPWKVDAHRGTMNGAVSSQWMNRPEDQRFLSISELFAKTSEWAARSRPVDIEVGALEAHAPKLHGDGKLVITHKNELVTPTNHAFGAIASLAGAPANYLRTLPTDLAARCLNAGFLNPDNAGSKSLYVMGGDKGEGDMLRAVTSQKYGRILDKDVVAEVAKVAGNGTGDTRWKVPGMIDWSKGTYNPNVDITKDTTTLYASDRDLFMFLVDDQHPVEVGKLPNGDPDLMFRGFYVWNSEVGARTFGVATMYLRGVCQNRCLWGVEGFSETTFRHTAGAPGRFEAEAGPGLATFADASTLKLVEGVKAAKAAIVATDADERIAFLVKLGISAKKAKDMLINAVVEEDAPPSSVWDMAQAITAAARECKFQDDRLKMEAIGGKLLDKVTA